eukprot:scaffold31_cov334-Pavlova_lutheri.AAC.19
MEDADMPASITCGNGRRRRGQDPAQARKGGDFPAIREHRRGESTGVESRYGGKTGSLFVGGGGSHHSHPWLRRCGIRRGDSQAMDPWAVDALDKGTRTEEGCFHTSSANPSTIEDKRMPSFLRQRGTTSETYVTLAVKSRSKRTSSVEDSKPGSTRMLKFHVTCKTPLATFLHQRSARMGRGLPSKKAAHAQKTKVVHHHWAMNPFRPLP